MTAHRPTHRTLVQLAILAALAAPALAAPPLDGARYLIIAQDAYVGLVQPLADWQTARALAARVVPLSVAGSTPSAVRSYIRNAWSNWPVRPEYVLIACSPSALSGYQYYDDTYYGDMTGDYRMEIPVGRLPAENAVELRTMVAKTLFYSLLPDTTDLEFLLKGATVIGDEDSLNPDPYYVPDTRVAHRHWLDHGYTHIDSLYSFRGDSGPQATASLNDGRSFIGFRGVAGGFWGEFWDFYPDTSWHNGSRLPVFVSATCATSSVAPGEDMLGNLAMRWGDPDELGGAVAFFGTTLLGFALAPYRSAAFRGFFDAVYAEDAADLGQATLRSRFRCDSLFSDLERYTEWALFGDPALPLWTERPRTLEVTHQPLIRTGAQSFAVSVRSTGSPVAGAKVCLWQDSTVYAVDTTNASGSTAIAINPTLPGLLRVTVTGPNLRPYRGDCIVAVSGAPYVLYSHHGFNDSPPSGNGDGIPGPGETVATALWLRNQGDSVAPDVRVSLTTPDSFIVMLDTSVSVGTIAGLDSVLAGPAGLRFLVRSTCPDGRAVNFTVRCTDSRSRTWTSGFSTVVGAPNVVLLDTAFADSSGNRNGRPDPGETVQVYVELRNTGAGALTDAVLHVACADPRVTVSDSLASYGSLAPGARAWNLTDPLEIRIGTMVPETRLPFAVRITGIGFAVEDTVIVTFGRLSSRDPIADGPRIPPLYWAYDDGDTAYPEHPTYDWVETRGQGARLPVTVVTPAVLPLPAEFGPLVYYGRRYDHITVAAHGWLAPGTTSFRASLNQRLPKGNGPALIAPAWDGIYPDSGNGVWYWHDIDNHRLVITWDSCHYFSPFYSYWDRFQVVINDTTRAARDGNSEFTFQYATARLFRSATIGIQDSEGDIGITCLHDTSYFRASQRIFAGRAIKFTTDVPLYGIFDAPVQPTRESALRLPTILRGDLLRLPADLGPGTARVYDPSGRLLLQQSFITHHSSFTISLSSLPRGVYLLRLESSAPAQTHKLILLR
ncbi:MAG: C25 family cysteine peptidase [bacterium]